MGGWSTLIHPPTKGPRANPALSHPRGAVMPRPDRRDPSGPRPGRPTPAPPALLFGPEERLPGWDILNEYRDPLGSVLWQTLQDVLLWAGTPSDKRGELFTQGALRRRLANVWNAVPYAELQMLITRLSTAMIADPGTADTKWVADQCRRIAQWAESSERTGTALAFTQAAALVFPVDALHAVDTGLLALRRGDETRAETWFRRAVVLGRRAGGGAAQARAYLELGRLLTRRNQPQSARRFLLTALNQSRRRGLRDNFAAAAHELFELAREGKITDDPIPFASAAMRAYGAAHPQAPELVKAWARHQFIKLPPERLLGEPDQPQPFQGPPPARAYLLALIAREAAEAGLATEYDWAWDAAWRLIERRGKEGAGRHVRTYLELATASAGLQRWERAEITGRMALEAALARKDATASNEVEQFLKSLWKQRGGMGWIGHPPGFDRPP